MKIIFPAIGCLLLMTAFQNAYAQCDCPSRLSTGKAYARGAGVLVGAGKKIEPDGAKDQSAVKDQAADNSSLEQVAYIQVEKGFKGIKDSEVVLHQPADGCSPQFRVGQRWVLYASQLQASGKWQVFGCSRSRIVDFAADDLVYLGSLPQSATQTRISGVAMQYEQSPQSGVSRVKNVAGMKVKITGADKTYEATTDKNGVYEVYGLLPGRYTVQAEPPPGLRIRFPIPFGPGDLPEGDSVDLDLRAN